MTAPVASLLPGSLETFTNKINVNHINRFLAALNLDQPDIPIPQAFNRQPETSSLDEGHPGLPGTLMVALCTTVLRNWEASQVEVRSMLMKGETTTKLHSHLRVDLT